MSSLVSTICDRVYDKAPVVRNEVINRDRLSSAAATARMRLLDAMLTNAAEDRLGIQGTPPEFAIYLSIFRDSGIHRADARGAFGFHAPTDTLWQPVWTHIGRLLATGVTVPFDALIDELRQPPYGLRAGPSLPLIAAYVLAVGDHVAVLERGTFVPDLTVAHFMRLAKTPRNFAMRSLREPNEHAGLLRALAKGLQVIGECRPTIGDIAAKLYHWYNGLTPYALQTDKLSRTAVAVRDQLRRTTDPAQLFFRHLPDSCFPPTQAKAPTPIDPEAFSSVLNNALQELDQATDKLRLRATESILQAFEAKSLQSLRLTLRRDFEPHRRHLQDHRLAVLIDRAARQDVSNGIWLDGVAGHLVGKRPANWEDRTIDKLDLEVRIAASNLAKWLSLAQTAQGSEAGLRSVHVVGIDGHDRMVVLQPCAVDQSLEARMDAVRAILDNSPDTPEVLGRLLEDYIDRATSTTDIEGDS